MAEQLGYEFEMADGMRECVYAMRRSMENAGELSQKAIQEKYNTERFSFVSAIEAPESVSFGGC